MVVWIAALPTQASQRSVATAIKPNATSTANSGIAKRPQELAEGVADVLAEEVDEAFGERLAGAGAETGGAELDEAAAEDDDVPDALELAADDGVVCSC